MAETPPTRKNLPNPFYVLLLVASTLFVVTVLAYLAGPTLPAPRAGEAPKGIQWLAGWVDRNGPASLSVEILVMIATALLAMGTDRWFPEKPRKNPPAPR